MEDLPELPSFADLGYKDYALDNWFAVVTPSKTPKETLLRVIDWYTAALRVPRAETKLRAVGLLPVGTCGDAFAAHLRTQYDDLRSCP